MVDADFSLFELSLFDDASHVAVMLAYFDASESLDGYLTVAGYIFDRSSIKPFERLWRRMIKDHSISSFHMTDCNQQRGEFEGMTQPECDQCARKAIHAISKRALQGVTVSIRVADFHDDMLPYGLMPSPFSLCAQGVLMLCSQWADDHAPDARFAYVFESGDDYQSDVDMLLKSIGDDNDRLKMYHYHTHAFHPKSRSLPVQSADVLAWHTCKQWGRFDRGFGLRGDFHELLFNVPTRHFLWSREDIISVIDENKLIHGDNAGEVGGLVIRRSRSNQKSINQKISQIFARGD